MTTIAGEPGVPGSEDGPARGAHLNTPSGIAVSARGEIFIADTLNHVIRMITTDGMLVTIAGAPGVSGFADGDGADASLGGVLIQLVHLVEVRRAIAAMRVAASLPSMSFTDPMPMAGTTSIKAVHITELRSGLDEARAVIGLPPLVYTDPTITPGSTARPSEAQIRTARPHGAVPPEIDGADVANDRIDAVNERHASPLRSLTAKRHEGAVKRCDEVACDTAYSGSFAFFD